MNRKWLAIQAQHFIYYPPMNHFFLGFVGTPITNWFEAWNEQFLNDRLIRKNILALEFWYISQVKGNEQKGMNMKRKGIGNE